MKYTFIEYVLAKLKLKHSEYENVNRKRENELIYDSRKSSTNVKTIKSYVLCST